MARSRHARLALAALLLLVAPQARAASISIDPALKVLTCSSTACDSLTVQLDLDLGEVDVDSVQFTISVDNPSLIGLATGSVPGNPINGYIGGVSFDGANLVGSLNPPSGTFDDGSGLLQSIDMATIPLQLTGPDPGTVEFRFVSAEVFCDTCNGGAGQFYPVTNSSSQLLATVVVPEPGSASLLALGLVAFGAARRRSNGSHR